MLLVQICSDLLVCSVSRRKQKIMTDQMSAVPAADEVRGQRRSHLHQTGWRHTRRNVLARRTELRACEHLTTTSAH